MSVLLLDVLIALGFGELRATVGTVDPRVDVRVPSFYGIQLHHDHSYLFWGLSVSIRSEILNRFEFKNLQRRVANIPCY